MFEFNQQLKSKQVLIASRLKMIESIYNIKPADIIARIALDKLESG